LAIGSSAQSINYVAFGDSITDNGPACGDASAASACYADLVASANGWTLRNMGIGGAQAADESQKVYQENVPSSGAPRYSYMIGTNDAWGYGTDPDRQANFGAIQLANLAYLAIPEALKLRETDYRVSYRGQGWYQGTPYGGGIPAAICGIPGSSVSFTLNGSVIYISAGMQDGTAGQFSITIDGTMAGTYNGFGQHGSAIKTVLYGTTAAPQLIRIPVSTGSHTITFTVLSPTVWFDWAATNAGIDRSNGPLVAAGGPPLQRTDDGRGGNQPAEMQAYSGPVQANVSTLAADGLNVRYADTNNAFAGSQNGKPVVDLAITNGYDDVHPNDYGHSLLAQAMIAGFRSPGTGPATPVIQNGTYRIVNMLSGLSVDDPAFSITPNTQIIQWGANSGANQRWKVQSIAGTAYYSVTNLYSGMALTDSAGKLVQRPFSAADAQLWTIQHAGSGYTMTDKASGKMMADSTLSYSPGTGLNTSAASGGREQEWSIQ
jgi:lysophospholipase L1-like esterase